ncbi:type VII secretion protein EccB [Streptomyces canus]|uniref:Type VII secretion protein EccB n=1 Tax=Streptomyces canus TaxID=58343 RepID=A0AAW8FAT8_9ACTN|nr:type VII secretion protein EccB [Streptomyces canus]MDQ0764290.1 type VII secretion protein EccB [Streptomyces canus]MDQ0907251.1 type VII secretion protein EccB [Streptomyces canus]MDQ1067259.1 type VII secretion protein EccB [Streptomyces canus]
MATRRDELNAYSFARRRTVAAFLQPSPHGSEEAAPRPLKTVLPSLGVAALVLIGFGAWGMLSPTAPKGWDQQGKNILVGSESTTRYVLVKTKGENKLSLHPVLNLASAKLLLNGENPQVMKIKESVLDNSKYPMGATVGIPFAPDRLPSASDAEKAKVWALCEAPGSDGQPVRATYVLDQGDYDDLLHKGKKELNQREALYVEGPAASGDTSGPRYMVTRDGQAYLLGGVGWRLRGEESMQTLERAVFGAATPQKVSADFIKTLHVAGDLDFPDLGGDVGSVAHVEGLDPNYSKVGLILEADGSIGGKKQQYIVLKDKVQAVSDFTAQMWLHSTWVDGAYGSQKPAPVEVRFNDVQPSGGEWMSEKNWPEEPVTPANTHWEKGGNKVACSIWHGGKDDPRTGQDQMTVWTGQDYPKDVSQSGSSTYVSPGSGLLFKRLTGADAGGGSTFLVTDTGLRYSVPARNDSSVTGGEKADNNTQQQTNTAQVRLGYGKIKPVAVPAAWADLLAAGPELSSGNAEQAQGS